MKQRNPLAVLILVFLTLGIYSWYWSIKTKDEMNSLGENIPTAWIWLIPFIGFLWWDWKYCQGVEHVSEGKISAILMFCFLVFLNFFCLGCIGKAILQDKFNALQEMAVKV